MTSQTFLEKAAQSLKNNAFFRHGYQFAGWSTRPDGSGTLLKDGATIQLSASTELYAVWQLRLPPKTGDSASPMLWLGLCAISLLTAALAYRKARG